MPAASLIQILSIIGSVLVAGKLLLTGLYRRYPLFFLYLLFRVPVNLVPFFIDMKSDLYFYLWVCTEPIVWILYILVAQELAGLVFRNFRGLYTLGRWSMYAGIVG